MPRGGVLALGVRVGRPVGIALAPGINRCVSGLAANIWTVCSHTKYAFSLEAQPFKYFVRPDVLSICRGPDTKDLWLRLQPVHHERSRLKGQPPVPVGPGKEIAEVSGVRAWSTRNRSGKIAGGSFFNDPLELGVISPALCGALKVIPSLGVARLRCPVHVLHDLRICGSQEQRRSVFRCRASQCYENAVDEFRWGLHATPTLEFTCGLQAQAAAWQAERGVCPTSSVPRSATRYLPRPSESEAIRSRNARSCNSSGSDTRRHERRDQCATSNHRRASFSSKSNWSGRNGEASKPKRR